MPIHEESIEVDAPLSRTYNQWTQFEEFPRFMEGVGSVTQLDDRRLHWVAEVLGQRREWDAEITEQRPDERIAWTSRSGATNAGVVTFHRISDDVTRVMLQLEFEPEGAMEKAADLAGTVKRQVRADLREWQERCPHVDHLAALHSATSR